MVETAVTENIKVEVESFYVPEQSDKQMGRYFFSYKIRITNEDANHSIQLLSRHWIIKDGFGRVEEVKGPGVIGQQPNLPPKQSFEYESFCPLATPTGSMHGTYQMQRADGRSIDVKIPEFFLVEPSSFH